MKLVLTAARDGRWRQQARTFLEIRRGSWLSKTLTRRTRLQEKEE